MHTAKTALLLVVTLLVGILIVQNTEVVTLHFLVWEARMSQIILLLLVLIAGLSIGFLVAKWPTRSKKGNP
jgi:uncharacterized integral membrane protein